MGTTMKIFGGLVVVTLIGCAGAQKPVVDTSELEKDLAVCETHASALQTANERAQSDADSFRERADTCSDEKAELSAFKGEANMCRVSYENSESRNAELMSYLEHLIKRTRKGSSCFKMLNDILNRVSGELSKGCTNCRQ